MIQSLYNQKLSQGLSPKSIKNLHGCLHRALDIAVQIGYLTKNPTNACILPTVHQAEIHPLDTPDLKKLLTSIQGDEHAALRERNRNRERPADAPHGDEDEKLEDERNHECGGERAAQQGEGLHAEVLFRAFGKWSG